MSTKSRKAALAAMGAGALALFVPGSAKSHHRDTSQNSRLSALEASVASLKQRVAALEARGGGTPGAIPDYALSNVTTDRTLNANSYTMDEIADVLGTLVKDLGG